MTTHEIAPLIQASLATCVLALVVFKGGFSSAPVRWFALFIVGQMLWGLAVFGLRGSADLEWALRWEHLAPAAVSLTVISFYFFTRVMVRAPWPGWVTVIAAVHLLASLASIPTPYLVEQVEVASYGNTAVWGLGLIPWALPVYMLMSFTIVSLYRGLKSAQSYTEKNRLLLLLIAGAVSIVGSLLDVAPALGLDVPPATAWTNSLFFILAGFAILRYHLLDIQVALQHRFSYLIRSGANVALLAAGIPGLIWLGLPLWSIVVASLIVLLSAEPAWRRLDELLRARLEKDLRGEIQTLLTLGAGQTEANSLQVASTMIKLLHRVIHPSHSVVLLIREGEARPITSQGYEESPTEPLAVMHPLIQWQVSRPAPIFHRDLMVEPPFQTMTSQSRESLAALDAAVYIPLPGRRSLEGILAVGPKAADAIYSWQEIEFLQALGQQGARLLESIRLSEADREQQERMAHIQEIQRYMVQARDEERRSLAAEIHDDPIQMLVGSVVRLNLVRDSLQSRPELSRKQLDHVVNNLGRAEKSLRRIMTGVFPALLQDLGLLAALESLHQDLDRSGVAKTEVNFTIEVRGVSSRWDPPLQVGLVIYRFIQEGMHNVLAHSGATEARAIVDYGPENATIEVIDNGNGVDPDRVETRRKEGHVGLLGLEERLGALGGSISLVNQPEGGTRLSGWFPHQHPSPDHEARWSFKATFAPLPEAEIATSQEADSNAPASGAPASESPVEVSP